MRRILLVLGVIVAILAALAAFNGLVDPEDEFYSGDALSAAAAMPSSKMPSFPTP